MEQTIKVGQKFGSLTVQRRSYDADSDRWHCSCKCGRPVIASETMLLNGTKDHCGYPVCITGKPIITPPTPAPVAKPVLSETLRVATPMPVSAPKPVPAAVAAQSLASRRIAERAQEAAKSPTLPTTIAVAKVAIPAGMEDVPEYSLWDSIVQRCTNSSHPLYEYYGKRGVTIDPAWLKFKGFIDAVGAMPRADLFLLRKDSFGNYTKDNVYWGVLGHNHLGQLLPQSAIPVAGAGAAALQMPVEKTTRTNKRRGGAVLYDYQDKQLTLAEIAALTGITYSTMYGRVVQMGYTVDEAIKGKKERKPNGSYPQTNRSL